MTPNELIAALEQLDADLEIDPDCAVMLNIAGRWTGIKGVTADDGIAFIESED